MDECIPVYTHYVNEWYCCLDPPVDTPPNRRTLHTTLRDLSMAIEIYTLNKAQTRTHICPHPHAVLITLYVSHCQT